MEETALQREDADVLVFSGVLVRSVSGAEDAKPSTSQSEPSRPGSAEFAAVSKSLDTKRRFGAVRIYSICKAGHDCICWNYWSDSFTAFQKAINNEKSQVCSRKGILSVSISAFSPV